MSLQSLFKRLFKTQSFRSVVCWAAAQYIRLVYVTSRKRIEIDNAATVYIAGARPAVYAFWHARLLMIPPIYYSDRKMHIMISSHNDGEMIARTMHHFGLETIRGSSSRGGREVAAQAVKVLLDGGNVSITPDGPRGPAMKLQPGVITVAKLAGVPVIPVTYGSSRHKRMRSWDRFMLALPFGKLYYKVGAPMENPTKEALEAMMVQITDEVDAA